MPENFSISWKGSKKPSKQRKYVKNAPLHTKAKFLASHLSKELRKKYFRRGIRVRKGDKVIVLRGQFKKKAGAVEGVNIKKMRVFVSGIQRERKDGSKASYPLHASNLLITELNANDKERMKIFERKKN